MLYFWQVKTDYKRTFLEIKSVYKYKAPKKHLNISSPAIECFCLCKSQSILS